MRVYTWRFFALGLILILSNEFSSPCAFIVHDLLLYVSGLGVFAIEGGHNLERLNI